MNIHSRFWRFFSTFSAVFASCASPDQMAVRTVEQVIRSTATPQITINIDTRLRYIGHIPYQKAMGGVAEFEQYIFSETSNGQLGRTVIVHFEHVLPGNDFTFNYPRHDMVKLGRNEYLHQTFPIEDIENGGLFSSEGMQSLLNGQSLAAGKRWLINRYVRTVDDLKRGELIIFYLEPAGELPAEVSELTLGGSRRDLWEPIARDLAKRATAAFMVFD